MKFPYSRRFLLQRKFCSIIVILIVVLLILQLLMTTKSNEYSRFYFNNMHDKSQSQELPELDHSYLFKSDLTARLLIRIKLMTVSNITVSAYRKYEYIIDSYQNKDIYSQHKGVSGQATSRPIESMFGNLHFLNQPMGPFLKRKLMTDSNMTASSYPKDLFTADQLRKGAIVLHITGMVYMFIALAVVCDEFFVPTLIVITGKFGIAKDVSGGTFMAAGGSAPEFFTSVIGVFVSKNDVGIGTIVGSAVFNILFVIGTSVVLSKEAVTLHWWPIFREVSFYSFSLSCLIGFFSDDKIEWWEAFVMFLCYVSYITFMKFNCKIEHRLKELLNRCKLKRNKVGNSIVLYKHKRPRRQMNTKQANPSRTLYNSRETQNNKGVTKHGEGVVQLIIQTDDLMKKVYGQPSELQDRRPLDDSPDPFFSDTSSSESQDDGDNNKRIWVLSKDNAQSYPRRPGHSSVQQQISLPLEETESPLDLSWPDTLIQRVTYILLAPIMFALYITLPDVRVPERRKFFPLTFVGCILWIGGFSYCLVWWARQAGGAVGVPDQVMGLTVLAASSSIPDLVTGVIVVKKGFGDMAFSSSIGSNIFDITVGLPLPWLIHSAISSGAVYTVTSKGLLCTILLLFLILLAVVVGIAVSDWKPSRPLGVSMLLLYLVFVTVTVLLEHEIIVCPNT